MAESPLTRVPIRQWPGMASAKSPLTRKPGEASEQLNCRSISDGILEVRGGERALNGWTTAETYGSIISAYNDQEGAESQILVHTANGFVCLITGQS